MQKRVSLRHSLQLFESEEGRNEGSHSTKDNKSCDDTSTQGSLEIQKMDICTPASRVIKQVSWRSWTWIVLTLCFANCRAPKSHLEIWKIYAFPDFSQIFKISFRSKSEDSVWFWPGGQWPLRGGRWAVKASWRLSGVTWANIVLRCSEHKNLNFKWSYSCFGKIWGYEHSVLMVYVCFYECFLKLGNRLVIPLCVSLSSTWWWSTEETCDGGQQD